MGNRVTELNYQKFRDNGSTLDCPHTKKKRKRFATQEKQSICSLVI